MENNESQEAASFNHAVLIDELAKLKQYQDHILVLNRNRMAKFKAKHTEAEYKEKKKIYNKRHQLKQKEALQ